MEELTKLFIGAQIMTFVFMFAVVAILAITLRTIILGHRKLLAMQQVLEKTNNNLGALREIVDQEKDRLRSELSIHLLLWWSDKIDPNWVRVRRFLEESLDDVQLNKIALRETVVISQTQLNEIRSILTDDRINKISERGNDEFEVPVDLVEVLRADAINYLNLLESILTAWKHDVANRNIIEEQFQFSVVGDVDAALLGRFREADGSKHFPSVQAFVEHIKRFSVTPAD